MQNYTNLHNLSVTRNVDMKIESARKRENDLKRHQDNMDKTHKKRLWNVKKDDFELKQLEGEQLVD